MDNIDELFRKFVQLDSELKQLRQEVGEVKGYYQNMYARAVAYSVSLLTKPKYPKSLNGKRV
ncbi:hypothetical protein [Pseudomonas sp.]|uniref:hypothetical protein n=1 Tax=Pseudomonas sp. TaxID=306 RepID=UPI003FD841BC